MSSFLIIEANLFVILVFLITIIIIKNFRNIDFFSIDYLKNKNIKKIKIGTSAYFLSNGGRARITSLLLNYLLNFKLFEIYLFTINKDKNEYMLKDKINRILIYNILDINNLIRDIKKKRIDIFIYQLSFFEEIKKLNNIKKTKIIFYQHQSFFLWIYTNYSLFKSLYKVYKESNYIISLIPFESDYIFRIWGIKSILMNNFMTYEYNSCIPSDLSLKTILMIGRAENKFKRFILGILAMEYVNQEIPECEMIIISNISDNLNLKNTINNINLEKSIKFYGYQLYPERFFKKASLHFFSSISESFGLVLCETKIYGIPNIMVGLDYLTVSNGGTIIIYDDLPEKIAKEIIKILIKNNYKIKLGKKARKSMRIFENKRLVKKWIRLILSIYINENIYLKKRKLDKKIEETKSIFFLQNQIKLLNERMSFFKKINFNNIKNFTFLNNLERNFTY